MLTYLYNLIIAPLVLIVEVIFTVMSRMIGNMGFAIIAVSVVVSVLILPLYRRADAVQEAERDKQAAMEHWVSHIKKTFKGDEQYMMLTTYYRQMNYHPLYSLRSSISLLLQIPFFNAAYRFLSGLGALRGISFGPIADLSAPDGIIRIAGLTINALPILMTVINLLSGAVYSRGLPLKMKLQQYGLTLLFLVLLYRRPAGLVLYWTMNNVFSLVKNLITKVSRHPQRDAALCSAALGVGFFFLVSGRIVSGKRILIAAAVVLVSFLPLLLLLRKRLQAKKNAGLTAVEAGAAGTDRSKSVTAGAGRGKAADDKGTHLLFILGGIFLTILAGYVIPISVISDSPSEFININAYVTPLRFVFHTISISAGFFLVWANIFYALSTDKVKKYFSLGIWVISIGALINYMIFAKNFGSLSTQMVFDKTVEYGKKRMLLNLLVLAAAAFVLYTIWKRWRGLIRSIYLVGILGLMVLCVTDTMQMQSYIKGLPDLVPASQARTQTADEEQKIEPLFRLSRTGKNVIVLMMDRMISAYLPYILKERPELETQFDGFTWYPNTLSYGSRTNFGSPALYGGYEYTPVEMNKRDTESLKDKQNELLKVMPVMFLDEGYEVTVCDPSYAGYSWIPDLSIYDDYPEIKTYNTLYMDEFTRDLNEELGPQYRKMQLRNFFCFSVFRMMPTVLQAAVYDDGFYLNASNNNIIEDKLITSYGALTHLPDMTQITDDDTDTFLMMANKTTHEDALLQMPDYVPSLYIDNSQYFDESIYTIDGVTCRMDKRKHQAHYDVNIASMLILGRFMDYLRENDVYDNTRIIIVADHGKKQNQIKTLKLGKIDVMTYNPMLLVKDFDAAGGITTCNDFMTNADTPVLATNGLIENPVNPFTGKAITSDEKTEHAQVITTSNIWRTERNNSNVFDTSDGEWYAVKDDIFKEENWTLLENETEIPGE